MHQSKKILFNILIINILSISIISCKKEISLDLRTVEPIVVIEAEIAKGNKAEVQLTQTRNFYDSNTFLPITDAKVTLSNNFGDTESLILSEDGVFKSDNIKGEINTTYYLSVDYKQKTYTSASTLYPPVPIDSVAAKLIRSDFPPYFQIYWQEHEGKEIDYYRFCVYINDSIRVKQNFVASADIYDGEHLSLMIMIPENNSENEQVFQPGDVIRFEMLTLDRSAGEYFTFLSTHSETNPPTNITGGALGYFSAYSVNSASVTVPEWERKE